MSSDALSPVFQVEGRTALERAGWQVMYAERLSPASSRRAVDFTYDPDEEFPTLTLVPDETEYDAW